MNDGTDHNSSPVRWPLVTGMFLLSLTLSSGWLYQQHAETAWSELPVSDGSLESAERRLAALEDFMGSHPIWLGAHEALSEKTDLSTQVQVLRTQRAVEEANAQAERTMQKDAADSAHLRGTRLAETGDFRGALSEFREALEIAPEDWSNREQVEREVMAFEEYLETEGADADDAAPSDGSTEEEQG